LETAPVPKLRFCVGQQRFLTFEDEQAQLATLEIEYEREAAWRLEQSHLALARRHAMPQRPRASWQDRELVSAAAPAAATSLEQRANAMRQMLRHLREFVRKAARWAADHADAIARCDPAIPDAIFNRVADNWAPLLAIAEVRGGDVPDRAREMALASCGDEEETSFSSSLLVDIRCVFNEKSCERIFSADLMASLIAMPDRPWGECNHGKALTQNWLARRLKTFGIAPKTMRIEDGRAKGFYREDFADAFFCYLSPDLPFSSVTPGQHNTINDVYEK
jgi:hypothetical protein